MQTNWNRILLTMAGAAMGSALLAVAQTPAPAAAPAPAAPAAPAAPTWSVGPMDLSGFIDGYYSYNFNTPDTAANGQTNDYYNFNDKTGQFNLSAAKLTLNHDPDPVGAHIDVIYGRTNKLMNGGSSDQLDYIEQAYLSVKPPKAKGFELDFGKFVTVAGAEVIEAKDNWAYSRGLLFSYAIPYYHFGVRTSFPISKTDTIGLHVVNGWNNVSKDHSGATICAMNSLVKPKYTWNANYLVGPENPGTTTGMRNLIDTTLLLTPTSKFNAYINYDYGQNRDAKSAQGDTKLNRWQGVAFAGHGVLSSTQSLTGRYEYFKDYQGFMTGTQQKLQEFTATYESKWAQGLLSRIEYRYDWSDQKSFHKAGTAMTDNQSTITASLIAFFGPKR